MMLALIALAEAATATMPSEAKMDAMRISAHRYFDCISDNAEMLARHNGSVQVIVDQVLHKCVKLRAAALEDGVVPLAFPSVENFDEVHKDLALDFVRQALGIKT